MFLGVPLLLLSLLARAAWQDLRHRRIPNDVLLGVLVLWLAYRPSIGLVSASLAVAVAIAVLTAGICAWRFGWLGAGDVKLLTVLSLWAGPDATVELLLVTGVAGGVLGLVALVARTSRPSPLGLPLADGASATRGLSASVPYGVAIALGGVWVIATTLLA